MVPWFNSWVKGFLSLFRSDGPDLILEVAVLEKDGVVVRRFHPAREMAFPPAALSVPMGKGHRKEGGA